MKGTVHFEFVPEMRDGEEVTACSGQVSLEHVGPLDKLVVVRQMLDALHLTELEKMALGLAVATGRWPNELIEQNVETECECDHE